MEPTAIPFTAWEQAVFVALFIVMVIGLLGWFTKQQKSWQDFMNDQNSRWQKAVDEQNNQWQKWLEQQNTRECDSMDKVTMALDRLTSKLSEHDEKVEARFSNAIDELHRVRRKPTTKVEKEYIMWQDFVSVFAQEFLGIVLPVLSSLLAGLFIAWITKLVTQIKAQLDTGFIWMLDEAVRVAVLAAEQANLAGFIEDKKVYAMDVAEKWLAERGFKIDLGVLADRIEAAVMEEFNKSKQAPVEELG